MFNSRKELCDELCRLLGYKTWEIEKCAYKGRARGPYEYSLKFEDGKTLFICAHKELFDPFVSELIDSFKRTSKEGYKRGDVVKTKSGRVARVVRVGFKDEKYATMLYLAEELTCVRRDEYRVKYYDMICTADEVELITEDMLRPTIDVKDDYKPGDRVKHKGTGEVGTIVSVREGEVAKAFGSRRKLYTIDFGRSIIFAFDIEMNMGEYLAEALEAVAA